MLLDVMDWQRQQLRAWLDGWSTLNGSAFGTSPADLVEPWLRRNLAIGDLPDRSIEEGVAEAYGGQLEADLVWQAPFVRLVRLADPRRRERPPVILAAPHSGYAAVVLSELVAAILPVRPVIVTDWIDPRLVPLSAGGFGHAEQVAVLLDAARLAGPGGAMIAVSQAGWAALEAAAAGNGIDRLVLLGAPIDPTVRPPAIQQGLALLSDAVVRSAMLRRVAAPLPGRGRRTMPGSLQLAAYAASTASLYGEIQLGALVQGLGIGPAWRDYERDHRDIHAIMDVPAELFLDLVARMRGEVAPLPPLARTGPAFRLVTVEIAGDTLVGPGQCHAAHRHAEAHIAGRPVAVDLPPGAHSDLFIGPILREAIGPFLRAVVA